MADVKKMATRDGYGKGLVALGAEHPDVVVLDADLAGSTKTGMFAKVYPDRHFNCGIAEGNMMSVAAGLAASGMTPFASSFAMFASGRAFEQIRNSIGYPMLNVKIGASHGGRRFPSVLRGLRPDALHPRHGGHLPRRRRGS